MSGEYELRLYVLGSTPASTRAVANLRAVVDEHLDGRASLEVIDVYEHPERAAQDQVLAVPTLVRSRPAPVRRLLGDLSDRPKVLAALDVPVLDQP
jgi:circadian clock protein KaiB